MKHTPEPWYDIEVENATPGNEGGIWEEWSCRVMPGQVYIYTTRQELNHADACVNACAGLDIEKVAALLDAVRAVASSEVGSDQYGQGLSLESKAMTDLEDSIRAAKGVDRAK